MTPSTSDSLDRFYALLARLADAPWQGRPLRELPGGAVIPERGVYFFAEQGEFRSRVPSVGRIVRVGTHAVSVGSKTTLRRRLKQHLGTRAGGGNHRGSIFRLHVGAALLARDGTELPTWGVGSSAPPDLATNADWRAAEATYEKRVSEYIGSMSVFWVNVVDEPGPKSERSSIERNAIALLSNGFAPIDGSSASWLGRFSPREQIRNSALWNLKYFADSCDARFLEKLEASVTLTLENHNRCQESGERRA